MSKRIDTRQSRIGLLCLLLLLLIGRAEGQNVPSELVPSEVERLDGEKIRIAGNYPGLIYIPRNTPPISDSEYQQNFKVACGVYIAERAGEDLIRYARRFIVYIPDAELLPIGRRVARTLQLLHALHKDRLRLDHARTNPTVEVWLLRQGGGVSAEAAGRQFKNQIYFFNLLTDRTPVEWLREVAHEYGHYILPGVSGFTAPEEWGNGVLGERLFLCWLQNALQTNTLPADALPFAKPEDLDAYLQAKIEPLLRKICNEGISEAGMKRKDAEGMNYFTGAALYVDAVHGSRALKDAFAYTESADGSVFIRSSDFHRGILKSLETSNELRITTPFRKRESLVESLMVYLPRGEFTVANDPLIKRWEVVVGDSSIPIQTSSRLMVSRGAWRKLKIYLSKATESPVTLTFTRRGVGNN